MHWNGDPRLGPFFTMTVQSKDDTISQNDSPWFWTNLCDRGAGKMRLPVHQWADAIRLFEPWRYGSSNLSNVGVSDDEPYSPPGPTSSASSTRHGCLYSAGWAQRVPLIEPAPQIFLFSRSRRNSSRFGSFASRDRASSSSCLGQRRLGADVRPLFERADMGI